MNRWFRIDYALAGVVTYVLVVVFANYEKPYVEIVTLAFRQALMSFVVTGTVVAYSLQKARDASLRLPAVLIHGVVIPALIVALSSLLAHWYFTKEVRNVLGPFLVSAGLNSFNVFLARRGYTTLVSQVIALYQIIKRPSR